MSVIGIIAEFNPLHKGHEYLLSKAKREGDVVCVLSGNFIQRGETAIAEKRLRAEAALKCGADLVLELPVLWSMSTAQNFALGGVSILKNAGCDKIMFGSECADVALLEKTASVLDSEEFSDALAIQLKKGITFATARQTAASACGLDGEILAGANNNLAVEYISAAKKIGFDTEFLTVSRKGAVHDSLEEDKFVSASFLRSKMLSGDYGFCEKYMPPQVLDLFSGCNISDMRKIETAVLAVLRTKTLAQLKNLPDISEGLENKLFNSIKVARNLEELYNVMKVKRYTLARIRRLVLSAFIGADNDFFMKEPPYIRVLGFNKKGEELLKNRLTDSSVPVITRVSDINDLSARERKVFDIECKATDLFSLTLPKPYECGLEYKAKIIKTE